MSKDKIDVTYAFLQIKLPRDNHTGVLMEVSAFVALRVAVEPDKDDKSDTYTGLLTSFNKALRAISKKRKVEEDERSAKQVSKSVSKQVSKEDANPKSNRTLKAVRDLHDDLSEFKDEIAGMKHDIAEMKHDIAALLKGVKKIRDTQKKEDEEEEESSDEN
jgi:seryl-tRNA synthetase